VLFVSLLEAETNYIDQQHRKLSDIVREWGGAVDDAMRPYLVPKESSSETKSDKIDSFFQSKKYTDTTKKAYIRLRFTNSIASKEPQQSNFQIRAQIPLQSLNEAFKLFIENTQENYVENLSQNYTQQSALAVGVNLFVSLEHAIESKYSLGIRSTELFGRAIYSKDFYSGSWKIEPQQLFEYTSNNIFLEETNIYCDNKLGDDELFRVGLRRATQQKRSGMEYSMHLAYYHFLSKETGYSFGEYFRGNTEYKDGDTRYQGIYEYATVFNWRERIYRKWIVYEIQPILSFHKMYDYKANTILKVSLEFYFGGAY